METLFQDDLIWGAALQSNAEALHDIVATLNALMPLYSIKLKEKISQFTSAANPRKKATKKKSGGAWRFYRSIRGKIPKRPMDHLL